MFKILPPLFALILLPGCSSLIASATGPEPIGKAAGERTFSMSLQDNSIETTAEVNIIKADERFRDANVNVVSFYNSVLLAGQVPTEDMKQKAEQVVRNIAEVRQIHNELTVGDVSYYGERTSDGLISTRLRTAYTLEKGFPSSRLKVFTVGGTVYLLGKLTQSEAEQAVLIASQLAGVKKIIKMIDYLPASSPATNS
jgi:osmotically-inducible protein OsmY